MTAFIKKLIHTHGRSILSFLTVGALAAILNFSLFSLCWGWLKINYSLAISISYMSSVIFHFTANRRFTFNSHPKNTFQQISRYAVMVAVNYCLTLLVMHYVVAVLGWSPYWGTIAAIGMTVGTGYILAKFWVFSSTTLNIVHGG
jgi:putative flippase GtrA